MVGARFQAGVAERLSSRHNRQVLQAYLEPQQQALSMAGAQKVVHMVRMALEEHETCVCLKLDVANAHSSMARAAILEVLEQEPSLRHMGWSFATSLASNTLLEVGGQVWGEAGDGLMQGKPSSGGFFCVGWHPEVRQLDLEVREGGGAARFFSDDGYVFGPPDVVFPAFRRFEEAIRTRCCLHLQREKTMVYCRGELPSSTPVGLLRAGVSVDGVFQPGFECVGVAVGSSLYVSQWLDGKVDKMSQVVEKTCTLLEEDLQAKWTILLASTQQKMGYWLALQYPSDVRAAATRLDSILWTMFERATGLHVPREDEGAGVECVLNVPVAGLRGQSFQSLMARLPIKERGMGLRSMVDTIPTAFLGALEMSLPFLTGQEGQCKLLEPILGDIREVDERRRWRTLIASGCRTARELQECWGGLQLEARECAAYLGVRLEDHLAVPLEGLGEGRVDGTTRQFVSQQRERLRAKVLSQALTLHHDQTARPVWGWPQFDKFSCSWLLATPSVDTFLSSKLFREAMASHLFLPSPVCQGRLGQPTGYKDRQGNPTYVDTFGDVVMSTTLCHDTWRTRHNDIQRALVSKAYEARVEVDAEVIGLFRDLIPAEAFGPGGELETQRQRNGCIPDLRLGLQVPLDPRPQGYYPRLGRRPAAPPSEVETASLPPRPLPSGLTKRFLAELKAMGAGSSRYPRGQANSRDKQVNRRARALPAEYRGKLQKLDSAFHDTRPGEVGPCQARFENLGGILELVVGAFGEVSADLDRLITALAESRVLYLSRETGRLWTDGWRSVVLGQYRRHFSVLFVRVQAACLTARLSHLGPESREMAGRRRDLMGQEQRGRKEAEAYHMAYVRGRGRMEM